MNAGKIVTVNANPSLDRTITLEGALRPGEVQAAASSREDAGGKGINVARVIAAAGVETVAVLPLAVDDPFAAALVSADVPARLVEVEGHVRANVTITDPAGVTTKLNLPGATLTPADVSALIDAVVGASRERAVARARRIPAAWRRRTLLRRRHRGGPCDVGGRSPAHRRGHVRCRAALRGRRGRTRPHQAERRGAGRSGGRRPRAGRRSRRGGDAGRAVARTQPCRRRARHAGCRRRGAGERRWSVAGHTATDPCRQHRWCR